MNTIQTYLKQTGLYKNLINPIELEKIVQRQAQQFQALQTTNNQGSLNNLDTNQLFIYQAPKFISNACSLDYGTTPYDLEKVLGTKNEKNARYLKLLNDIVATLYTATKVGWIGIYKKYPLSKGDTLVKLAYRGLESRAEFPLYNPDFKSNNKTVGLSGQAILINDIDSYLSVGGAYYECDATVQAELCLPIFNSDFSKIIGIVDAEDHQKYYFNSQNTMEIIALCINLSHYL